MVRYSELHSVTDMFKVQLCSFAKRDDYQQR